MRRYDETTSLWHAWSDWTGLYLTTTRTTADTSWDPGIDWMDGILWGRCCILRVCKTTLYLYH